jgi:hypothetical protein
LINASDSLSCNKPLASIAGTLNKKENLAATSRFNPRNNPPVIVVPDLDEPGINATACANPIKIESITLLHL